MTGGLLLLGAGPWAAGRLGAFLALLAGIWFAIGPDLSLLWHTGGQDGAAHGGATRQMLERLTIHTGLGVLITGLAAFALPGVFVAYRSRRAEPAVGERVAPGTAATGTPAAAYADPPVATEEPVTREPVADDGAREPVGAALTREHIYH